MASTAAAAAEGPAAPQRPPAFTLADGNTVYAVLGTRPSDWAALPADALAPAHFDAFPDEIPGWQQLSKNAIKRGLTDVRWDKLRAERSRRKLAASAARMAAAESGGATATAAASSSSSSKRARPADLEHDAEGDQPASKRRRGGEPAADTVPLGAKLRQWAAVAASGVRVVIDCNFTRYMHSGELMSMFGQLRSSYAAVRKFGVQRPLRLVLTSVTSEWLDGLDNIGDGTWRSWPIDAYEQHFMEVFASGPPGSDGAVGASPIASAAAAESSTVGSAAASGAVAAVAGAGDADGESAGPASWPVSLPDVRRVRPPAERTQALMRARDGPPAAGAVSGGAGVASCDGTSAAAASAAAAVAVDRGAVVSSGAAAAAAPSAANVYALPTPLISNGASKLVYLTPDTDVTLRTLDPECVYIVGGFVDKNRNKLLTATIAKQHGIATAKLPLDEHIDVKHAAVLTTNHVLTILARVAETGDWHSAIVETVPMRKGYAAKATATPPAGAAPDADDDDDDDDEGGTQADAGAAGSTASP